MSDTTFVGRSADNLNIAPRLTAYSKVRIDVSEDLYYEAGDDTGRMLTVNNPMGTQKMAEDILSRIQGFQYQPMNASGAILDPASEIGDGVTINGVYGGIFSRDVNFGLLHNADISAPGEEAIDHEYPYQPKADRKINRRFDAVESEFVVTNERISAVVREITENDDLFESRIDENARSIELEVSNRKAQGEELSSKITQTAETIKNEVVHKTDGSTQTFGWTMDVSAWTVHATSKEIFKINKDGAYIDGEIRASKGKIGGFDIMSDYLTYNSQSWGGTNYTGIYIGQQGIQCGSYNSGFRVDNNGNLYANNGYFRGNVQANMINYGGSAGYFDGAGLSGGSVSNGKIGDYAITSGKISGGAVGTSKVTSGINSSLGNGDYAYDVSTGNRTTSLIKASSFILGGHTVGLGTISGNKVLVWV